MKQKYETSDSSLSFLKDELFVPSSSSSSSSSQLAQLLVEENNSPSVRHTTLTPSRQEEIVQHHDDRPFVGSYNPDANQSSVPKQTIDWQQNQQMLFKRPPIVEAPRQSQSNYDSNIGRYFDERNEDGEEQLPFPCEL